MRPELENLHQSHKPVLRGPGDVSKSVISRVISTLNGVTPIITYNPTYNPLTKPPGPPSRPQVGFRAQSWGVSLIKYVGWCYDSLRGMSVQEH